MGCRPKALEVSVGEPRRLDPNAIGVNGNLTHLDAPWENERLLAAFQEMGVRHLRYPAGTLGNYWDWDEGWVDVSVPDSLMISWVVEYGLKQSPNRYTLENLALSYRRTGAEPVFMLNMLSKDLDHSLRNLRRARELGLPVRYIELGNELYFNVPFPLLRYPSPEDYGRTCAEWIAVLRPEFPEARFAVVGSTLDVHPRQRNWTQRVLAACPTADAVTYHTYGPSGLDGRRNRRNFEPGREGLGNPYTATRTGPENSEERRAWERDQLRDPAAYANLLTTARTNARGYEKLNLPDETDLWITEFNMRDDSSAILGSWAQCLLLSVYYREFLEGPATLTTVHNIVGPLFGLIDTDSFEPTAAGVVTTLFARAAAGSDSSRTLSYPEAPLLTDDRGQTVTSVAGHWFSGATHRALVANYGSSPVHVKLPSEWTGGRGYTYRAPLDRRIEGWGNVDHTTTDVFNGELTLPSHSLTLLNAVP
jgi:hypothetical protein